MADLKADLHKVADGFNSYSPRNEGELVHVEFIRNLLSDATLRADKLDEIAEGYAQQQRVREAEAQLAAAHAGTGSGLLGPDTVLTPDAG